MTVRIKAITPRGTFFSRAQSVDEDEREQLIEFLQNPLSYFKMKLDDGSDAVFSKDVCAKTVWVIEDTVEF